MIYNRNREGYSDPTAGEALANIRRQEIKERQLSLRKERKKKPIKKTNTRALQKAAQGAGTTNNRHQNEKF